jgi:hypothetical protein
MDDEQVKEAAKITGATYPDDETGGILFGAYTTNDENKESPFAFMYGAFELIFLEDVTVTVSPDKGIGPIYVDDKEEYDTSLKATSEAGWGVIDNLEPGDYELTFTHPTMTCSAMDGSPTVEVRVIAGMFSHYNGGSCVAQ